MATGSTLRSDCEKCGLYAGCKSAGMSPEILPDKDGNVDIVFLGEAPGFDEDASGVPFVGRSGQLLREAVQESGLHHFGRMYTNVVHCRPPENKTPSNKHINCCKPLLMSELEDYQPLLIMPLGNTPLKALLGETGITNWRGVLVEREDYAILPTFHPAYILRNDSAIADWLDDFDKAYEFLTGDVPDGNVSDEYEYHIVDNYRAAVTMMDTLLVEDIISWDTEANGLRYGEELVCMSFAGRNTKTAWAVFLDNPAVVKVCERMLRSDMFGECDFHKVGHNVKFDWLVIHSNLGFEVDSIVGDTMLMSYLIDPTPGRHGLKVLAGRFLGMYDYSREYDAYRAKHPESDPEKGGDLNKIPRSVLAKYAMLDAVATIELESKLRPDLSEKQLVLYNEMIMQASRSLARMESNGVLLDDHIVERYIGIYSTVQEDKAQAIRNDKVVHAYAKGRKAKDKKYEFNPNSSQQMADVLFDKRYYGLKPLGFTDTGKPTVKWTVIRPYASVVPMLGDYRYYKLLDKMLSTYLKPAVARWKDIDGRVRSDYRLDGARTGRLRSTNPNLQNIPTPEKEPGTLLESLPIKNIFTHTCEDGCILAVDYSGMELRTMASASKCSKMIDAFERDVDVHSFVTELLYHVKQADFAPGIWKPLRYKAKWVNWTLLFGGGVYTLVNTYGISDDEAQRLMDVYYDVFPEVLAYKQDVIRLVKETGYVESPFGRRRYMPYINDNNPARRKQDERSAVNMPIQSAASDILLCALIVIDNLMHDNGFKSMMVNTVHDSIMFDVYPGELDDLAWLCKEVMENLTGKYGPEWFPGLDFSWFITPLKVDMEVGTHYGTLEAYHT